MLNTMTPATTPAMRPMTAALSASDLAAITAASAWRVAAQAVTSAVAAPSYLGSDLVAMTGRESNHNSTNHNSIVRSAVPADLPTARRVRFGTAKQASPPRGVPR